MSALFEQDGTLARATLSAKARLTARGTHTGKRYNITPA